MNLPSSAQGHCERGREGEGVTDRQTQTDTDRHRQRERETETDREGLTSTNVQLDSTRTDDVDGAGKGDNASDKLMFEVAKPITHRTNHSSEVY